MSILDKIIKEKRREILAHEQEQSLTQLKELAQSRYQRRAFVSALRSAESPAVIAEIKRGSPSRGVIREDLDPLETALGFAQAGACGLSVLTDAQFFYGSISYVPLIREHLERNGFQTPILRKDFIIDPYQVWQTAAIGADALLLIVAALEQLQFEQLLQAALDVKLDVLIEVHNAEELERANAAAQRIYAPHTGEAEVVLGINNRDLHSFVCDLSTTEELSALAQHALQEGPQKLHRVPLISESGIFNGADVARLQRCAIDGFLIGEALVAEGVPAENLRRLCEESRTA